MPSKNKARYPKTDSIAVNPDALRLLSFIISSVNIAIDIVDAEISKKTICDEFILGTGSRHGI